MNARHAGQIRHGIVYARSLQPLVTKLGPEWIDQFAAFGPNEKLMRRAYELTGRGAAYRRAERLVRGKARRVYLRRHGLSA